VSIKGEVRVKKKGDVLEKILRDNFDSFFQQVHFYIEVENWYDEGIKKSAENIRDYICGIIADADHKYEGEDLRHAFNHVKFDLMKKLGRKI